MVESSTTAYPPRATASTEDMEPVLEVVEGTSAGTVIALSDKPLIVGKGEGAGLRLGDTGVSRQHAKFVVSIDRSVSVFDLASTNGTFVADTRIDVARVRGGDQIRFGPTATVILRYRPGTSIASTPDPADHGLSDRQLEVARLAARGLTNAAIASELEISPRTVKSHLDHIYTRLDIGSRTALAVWLAHNGLLDPLD